MGNVMFGMYSEDLQVERQNIHVVDIYLWMKNMELFAIVAEKNALHCLLALFYSPQHSMSIGCSHRPWELKWAQ